MPLFGLKFEFLAERVIGLAPEIPEDLYMLIRKVRLYFYVDGSSGVN